MLRELINQIIREFDLTAIAVENDEGAGGENESGGAAFSAKSKCVKSKNIKKSSKAKKSIKARRSEQPIFLSSDANSVLS